MDLCLRFAVSWLDYELYEKQFGDAELSNLVMCECVFAFNFK